MSRRLETVLWKPSGPLRWLLTPLSWLYALAAGLRNVLYDRGLLRSHVLPLPSVSIGNVSVGGTGKTPVSAWVAARLLAMGQRPAIVMRGYGADEPLVHQRLNPSVPVIVNPDRVAGAAEAARRGATVVVLDDAFQHRRARRDLDIVLVAAEQGEAFGVLPAGPLREWPRGIRRAQVLMVTRKSASRSEAERVAALWTATAGAPAAVVVALLPGALCPADATSGQDALPLDRLRGSRVLAVSAIGNPAAFAAQLTALGAEVDAAAFPDHHAFGEVEIRELTARAPAVDFVVCTLKDAVKLEGRWPAQAPPLWYLSQTVAVELGAATLDAALARFRPPQSHS